MKPIYSLTPISDHAKDLLAKIDTDKTNKDRNDKHEPFGSMYGKKPGEPAYTTGQVKGLESMYGYNKAKADCSLVTDTKNSKKENDIYIRLVNAHLTITERNLNQIDSGTFIFGCSVDFANLELYEECLRRGIKFIGCVLYPNGVNSPLKTP